MPTITSSNMTNEAYEDTIYNQEMDEKIIIETKLN